MAPVFRGGRLNPVFTCHFLDKEKKVRPIFEGGLRKTLLFRTKLGKEGRAPTSSEADRLRNGQGGSLQTIGFRPICETLYKSVEYAYMGHFWLRLSINAVPFHIFI